MAGLINRISAEELRHILFEVKQPGLKGAMMPIAPNTIFQTLNDSINTGNKSRVVLHPNKESSDLSLSLMIGGNGYIDFHSQFLLLEAGYEKLYVKSKQLLYRVNFKGVISPITGNFGEYPFHDLTIDFVEPRLFYKSNDESIPVRMCIRAIDSEVYLLQ